MTNPICNNLMIEDMLFISKARLFSLNTAFRPDLHNTRMNNIPKNVSVSCGQNLLSKPARMDVRL